MIPLNQQRSCADRYQEGACQRLIPYFKALYYQGDIRAEFLKRLGDALNVTDNRDILSRVLADQIEQSAEERFTADEIKRGLEAFYCCSLTPWSSVYPLMGVNGSETTSFVGYLVIQGAEVEEGSKLFF